ncbi:MAG: hypothetical protein WAW07_11430 [Bacteroidales bacterium]
MPQKKAKDMTTDTTANQSPKSASDFFRSWKFWRPFLGIAAGGIGGYLYYYFIGCNSGTCPITSSPYGSIIMGALLGYLLFGSPWGKSDKEKTE